MSPFLLFIGLFFAVFCCYLMAVGLGRVTDIDEDDLTKTFRK